MAIQRRTRMAYYKLTPAIPTNGYASQTTIAHWIDTDRHNDVDYNILRLQLMYNIEKVTVSEVPYSEYGGHKPKLEVV